MPVGSGRPEVIPERKPMNKWAARYFTIATPQAETVFDEANRT